MNALEDYGDDKKYSLDLKTSNDAQGHVKKINLRFSVNFEFATGR